LVITNTDLKNMKKIISTLKVNDTNCKTIIKQKIRLHKYYMHSGIELPLVYQAERSEAQTYINHMTGGITELFSNTN